MRDDLDGKGVLIDLDASAAATVVAFGGLTTDGEVARFEFFRFLSEFDVGRVFLRDHEQAWYQFGVRTVADTLDGVGDYLRQTIGTEGLRRSIFTGGSMGGYAAMLLGSRLGVAEVHAFAPQTFISRRLRRYYRDFRWQKQINHAWERTRGGSGYGDIKGELRRSARRAVVPVHLHVGTFRTDLSHVARVRRIPGVEIHSYSDIGTHNVAGELNGDGRLQALFDDAVRRVADSR